MSESLSDRYFLKNNQIFLWGEIQENMALRVIQYFRYLVDKQANEINLFICSDGGCVDSANAIIDEILSVQKKDIIVRTITQGKAYSAAAFILALGTPGYRFATTNSSIMLHPASFGLDNDYAGQQKKVTEFYSKQLEQFYKMVAKACKQTTTAKFKKFMTEVEKGLWLTAPEAKKYGVIDSFGVL